MPQADLLSFSPTLCFLPVIFLGGYFVFAGYFVPRLMVTFRARSWLTRWEIIPLGGFFSSENENWPELFLLFLQFGGLLVLVSWLTLVSIPENQLFSFRGKFSGVPTLREEGSLGVENFFHLWETRRDELFFRPAGAELHQVVETLVKGFGFFTPGKQFPFLGGRLRQRFLQLSESLPPESHD